MISGDLGLKICSNMFGNIHNYDHYENTVMKAVKCKSGRLDLNFIDIDEPQIYKMKAAFMILSALNENWEIALSEEDVSCIMSNSICYDVQLVEFDEDTRNEVTKSIDFKKLKNIRAVIICICFARVPHPMIEVEIPLNKDKKEKIVLSQPDIRADSKILQDIVDKISCEYCIFAIDADEKYKKSSIMVASFQ